MTNQKEYITIKELAGKLGVDKSYARKYVINHGYTFDKIRTNESQHQLTLALSIEDAETIIEMRQSEGYSMGDKIGNVLNGEDGYFYIIQLIPEFNPNRIKLGFATGIDARLKSHKTSAPTAILLKSWACKRIWENAAISSITRIECKLIGGEVYDCDNLNNLLARAEAFFSCMP